MVHKGNIDTGAVVFSPAPLVENRRMRVPPKLLALACWVLLSVPIAAHANGGSMGARGGFASGRPAGVAQPWSGTLGSPHGQGHVSRLWWRAGHWWHGTSGRRHGWWWVVGPSWYWYPFAVYPYPDFYTPADLTPGYWYWCNFYLNYYPDVSDCPTGWQPYLPQ
jgi:hypothetical protein